MHIVHSPPIAGRMLKVNVMLDDSVGSIAIRIDTEYLVASEALQCPDPPCYEQREYLIPMGTAGQMLHIEGFAPSGSVHAQAMVQNDPPFHGFTNAGGGATSGTPVSA